ncbi:MAG: hypothetical protein IIX54_01480 [Clostridia bacterium]|nr:hypothetical protein [Clostridia bacterium]
MDFQKTVVYQDLEDIYVLCIRKVITEVCSDLWRANPEGAFGTFKKYDIENTKAVNEQKIKEKKEAEELLREGKIESINYDKFKPIVAITSKAKSFKKFDFQACNNTLAYIEPVYTEIANKYRFNTENFVNTSKELSKLRNKLAHPDPNDSPSKIVGYQKSCINYMNFMFGMGLDSVKKEDGSTYYEQFQKNYLEYMEQSLQRWYYLTDFLDLNFYDASRFLEVCANNNIKADKKDAKYLFCTSNIDKTIEILKNSLATVGDNIVKAEPRVVQQSAPAQNKKSFKLIYAIIGVACVLVISGAIVLSSVLPKVIDIVGGNNSSETTTNTSSKQATTLNNDTFIPDESSSDITSSTVSETSSTNENTETNQIPSKHEQAVLALQHASDLALRNSTLNVSVGDYITPPPALVWDNVTIYSQDTSIAIGEGSLVRGVSAGTTYIIVESELGSASAFCVVVK